MVKLRAAADWILSDSRRKWYLTSYDKHRRQQVYYDILRIRLILLNEWISRAKAGAPSQPAHWGGWTTPTVATASLLKLEVRHVVSTM
jgi:hypothetical protein